MLLPVSAATSERLATSPPTEEPSPSKRPRVDWQRHTFGCDVWQCPCGGRRAVVAMVTRPSTAEAMLKNLGLWPQTPPLPAAQGPPQRELLLEP